MAGPALDQGRRLFLERLLLQLRARYPIWSFAPRPDGFSVEARRDRARVSISLATLYARCQSPVASVPEEITRFVSACAPRLSAAEGGAEGSEELIDPETLVWCVRPERSVMGYSRSGELLLRQLPARMVAFVAEALPGEVMRGVSVASAAARGLGQHELESRADRNTAARLGHWRAVLEQQPDRRRWLFSEDILFSSSLLLVPEFLQAVAERGKGRAALAVPDRGMTVSAIDDLENFAGLRHAVRRLYGMSSSPLSPLLLQTDGRGLELHPGESRPRAGPRWLSFLRSL